MKRRKTQNIIFIYLVLILLFFAIITYIAFQINGKKKDIFIKSSNSQVERSISFALKFETNQLQQVVFDYTFWDEMIEFIQKKDLTWAKINVDPIITTYKVASACLYDALNKKVYGVTSNESKYLNGYVINDEVFDSLEKSRFIRFYDQTPLGIVEVFGSTVHPSTDPKRLTKPQGYLFISRFIDKGYLNILSEITGTDVKIVNDTLKEKSGIYRIIIYKPLSLFNNKVINYLCFEKDLPFIDQYEKSSNEFIGLFFLAALCFIITFLFVTRRWINKPLGIVEEVLASDDIHKAKSLNRFGREFVKIGQLISSYISQKKSLEDLKNRAEESDRLKSSFIANMSHEIRTPLNGILGFCELLCTTDPMDEAAESYRKIIRSCSDNLMQLMSDILDYSRIESGQLEICKEKLSTDTIITELSSHFECKAESLSLKRVDLLFKNSSGIFELYTDKYRLKQILINLIDNAIKFTEKGCIEVDYYAEKERVVFTVKDTGIGISKDIQLIIFERFWQAAQPKSKLYGGTGLGLALCKGLANLLGGEIRVESKVGVGSTFFVEIEQCHILFEELKNGVESTNLDK